MKQKEKKTSREKKKKTKMNKSTVALKASVKDPETVYLKQLLTSQMICITSFVLLPFEKI